MSSVRWNVEEFASIDSTNTYVAQRALEGADEGLVARADYQSAGRGRLDRTWEAPPRSGLLTSILFRPSSTESDLFLYTVLVALSARAALVRLCGVRPDLKWPNDLLVGDRKLGGVLAELRDAPVGRRALVVGIGINLTTEGPPEAHGTSVVREAAVTIEPRALLDILLEEVGNRIELLRHEQRDVLASEFAAALCTVGRRVRVDSPRGVVTGVAEGVTAQGSLLVQTPDGVVAVDVGDVTHVRHEPS